MGKLDGKVAVITGGGSGIGRAACLLFAQEGAAVVVADIVEASAQDTADLIARSGGKAIPVQADVAKSEDVARMVRVAVETFGRLDILYNNAGIEGDIGHLTADCTEENFDRILAVNLRGVFLGMKHAIPVMLQQGGGSIISTASLAGLVGVPGLAAYSASKGGVVQLTKASAIEYADRNIRINCICPGAVVTAMTDRIRAARGERQPRRAANPMGRSADPMEIARAALFLASDDASYVTGIALPVDGGGTAQ